ncbi:MAG: hypothetical protein KIT84_34725 [Labilithrix sp.]|nr:hypothetical protein [Labilithrix sp.]MCW5816204.1 hypothetical protein [Labilithrix sp.]
MTGRALQHEARTEHAATLVDRGFVTACVVPGARRMLRHLSFVLLFVVAACARGDEPTDDTRGAVASTSTSTSASAYDACIAIESALVRRRYRSLFGGAVTAPPASELAQVECSALHAEVARGRVGVNVDALARCVEEIDREGAATDGSWTFDPNGACAGVFRRRASDDACSVSLACGAGRYCDGASVFCPGTCRTLPALGEPCGPGWQCAHGAACGFAPDGLRCFAPPPRPVLPAAPLGAPCGGGLAECEPVALCVAGRCERRPTLGEACAGGGDCLTGFCDGATCAPSRLPEQPCAHARECIEDTRCVEGACRPRCR